MRVFCAAGRSFDVSRLTRDDCSRIISARHLRAFPAHNAMVTLSMNANSPAEAADLIMDPNIISHKGWLTKRSSVSSPFNEPSKDSDED